MSSLVLASYFSDQVVKKEPHYHDCHQIILILKGEAEIRVRDQYYCAKAGSVILFSRYEDHSIESAGYERYILQIEPSAEHRNNRIYSLLSNRPRGFCNLIDVADHLPEFHRLLVRITEEFSSNCTMSEAMLELLVEELLILLYRRLPNPLALLEQEQAEMILDLQHRFAERYDTPYTLEALAKEYNVSPSSLSHRFKEVTGMSVMEYLLSCRLAAAKNLLIETDLPIGEIVEQCGFSDSSNFSRTFKARTGLSPSAFRNLYK
ncbi:MAG: AraC family transcriptional regulator [Clostridia bacterium]|nr:AraC family transcriptional regulator [Clostridia bacterium]